MEKPPDPIENIHPAPEGRQTNLGLSPLRGWKYISNRFRWLRYAPPPANFRSASGAKTCVETLAVQFALRLPTQNMFFHALAGPQFDFVLRGRGFAAELRAFNRVPGKRASLVIVSFLFHGLSRMQQILARREVFELERA